MTRATRYRPGRRRRASRQSGIALILTLLVLAILVVLTVQLAFSVKVEERIVANTEDDAAFELAGARGAPLFLAALFRDDRKNGAPNGPVDTSVDIWADPKCPEARQLQIGDATVTIEVEDLERRIPLAWLADETKGPIVEVWLTRLITKLAPTPGDAAQVAKQIADRVREIEGVAAPAPAAPGAPPAAPAGAPAAGEPARPRRFVSLTQLLQSAGSGAADGSGSGSSPSTDAPPAEGSGIDRRFLYGDDKADPPTQGIAPFVTTWPIGAININTASAEVLFALLPEKNKGDEPLWDEADQIVEGIQKFRVDPDYQQKTGTGGTSTEAPPAGSEAPAAAGQQGASRQWGGTPFAKTGELAAAAVHAKLAQLFKKAEGAATPPAGGGGATPPPAAGAPAPAPAAAAATELQTLLGVESRFYAVRVKVRKGGGGAAGAADAPPSDAGGEGSPEEAEGVYRLVIVRDAQDVVTVLQVVEGRPQ